MLSKTTIHFLEQMTKTGPKKRGKRRVWTISSERFTKEMAKSMNKSNNTSDTKQECSKDTLCMYCCDAYSRSASRGMWIQRVACKLHWLQSQLYLLKLPVRWIGIICLKTNAVGCMLLLHCVTFVSNSPFFSLSKFVPFWADFSFSQICY